MQAPYEPPLSAVSEVEAGGTSAPIQPALDQDGNPLCPLFSPILSPSTANKHWADENTPWGGEDKQWGGQSDY